VTWYVPTATEYEPGIEEQDQEVETQQNQHEFVAFPKMARLFREVIISEKIDGTNACIKITEDGQFLTGSRSRWITPDDDNFGFSKWAHDRKDELMKLGVGTHFGEWWGSGIQRGYGLQKGEKRFSLFNVARWLENDDLPAFCNVVPVLFKGLFATSEVEKSIVLLSRVRILWQLAHTKSHLSNSICISSRLSATAFGPSSLHLPSLAYLS